MLKEQIEDYLNLSYFNEKIDENTKYQINNDIMFLIRKEINDIITNKDEYKNIEYNIQNYNGDIIISMNNLFTASIFFSKYVPYDIISKFEEEGKFIYPDGEILKRQGYSYSLFKPKKVELINIVDNIKLT